MPYGSDPTTPPQGRRRSTLEMAPPETSPSGDSPPGMPEDAAAPPSGLDRLWRGLNPIGTAHAAYGSDPTAPPASPPQTGGYGRDRTAPPATPPQQPAPQQQQQQ